MKTLMIVVLLLTACAVGMGNEVTEPLRHIELSTQNKPAVFLRDVPILVRYHNKDEKKWSIPSPTQSTEVYFRRQRTSTDTRPGGYSLARQHVSTTIMEDGTTLTMFSSETPETIDIEANESHEFTIMLDREWTGNITPGRWTVWIKDNNLKLESNRIEIALEFTNESIGACLEIARNKDASVSKRKWHAEYLQKFMPDLHLRWWHMPPNEPEPHQQKQMEQAIQRELDRFETFWKDEANAPAIKKTIDQINREAGLEVKNTNSVKSNPTESQRK